MTLATLALLVFAASGPVLQEKTSQAAEISTTDTVVQVMVADDSLRLASIKCPGDGISWMSPGQKEGTIPLLAWIEVGGVKHPIHWQFTEVVKEPAHGDTILCYVSERPALRLRSICAVARRGPVEHRIEITNREPAPVMLPLQPTLAFAMECPSKQPLEQWWIERGGSRPSDVGTHRDPIVPGFSSSLVSTPYGGPIPWICVQDVGRGRGWYAGVEFSGFVRLSLHAEAGTGKATRVHALFGLGKSDAEDAAYRTRLGPGETFETPTVFLGCYRGSVDDGANRLRRWVETNLRPSSDRNLPLLTNNSWGDGMAVDETMARRMIDLSAELGIELFGVDAGWYRRVGDWRELAAKFPKGLATVADYTHKKGLCFGLWIGWTQGGHERDESGRAGVLSVNDPAMKTWFPQDYPATWRNSDFTGATVCLAEPKAVQWCLADMRRAVQDFKLDMLEHDQELLSRECSRLTHRHTSSPIDVAYHAARGYYEVQDGLRARFPNLLLEDCSNGGNLVDYGVVRRTHYVSITDTYDPLSNRRAFFDSSYALPPAMCECYIENRPGKTLANFLYMLRSGMMGWCTIMADMNRWSPEQRAAAKTQFDVYKQRLRPLIQKANLYHVSERPDGKRWDGIEFFDPARGQGVLFAFRGTTSDSHHQFRLQGLDPAAKYRLTCQDGSSGPIVLGGEELMQRGINVVSSEPESSELVYVTRQ